MVPQTSPRLGSGKGDQTDAAHFMAWRDKLGSDPDVGQESRMMVPVFYDIAQEDEGLGVPRLDGASRRSRLRQGTRSDRVRPGRQSRDRNGTSAGVSMASYPLAYPVTAEVYVTKILARDEFRQHCDRYKTRAAILANLP